MTSLNQSTSLCGRSQVYSGQENMPHLIHYMSQHNALILANTDKLVRSFLFEFKTFLLELEQIHVAIVIKFHLQP